MRDAIEDFDHRTDLDVESGLLEHLPRDAGLERLAGLDRAARKAPLPGERLEAPLHEHDAAVVHDDAPTPTNGRSGYLRWSLTTPPSLSRRRACLRWPSNSA